MSKKSNYIVGLDIGTTKICCIIGEVINDEKIDIIGLGQYPSKGLRKGVVVNIDSTVESIKNAVEEAELNNNLDVTQNAAADFSAKVGDVQFTDLDVLAEVSL